MFLPGGDIALHNQFGEPHADHRHPILNPLVHRGIHLHLGHLYIQQEVTRFVQSAASIDRLYHASQGIRRGALAARTVTQDKEATK